MNVKPSLEAPAAFLVVLGHEKLGPRTHPLSAQEQVVHIHIKQRETSHKLETRHRKYILHNFNFYKFQKHAKWSNAIRNHNSDYHK